MKDTFYFVSSNYETIENNKFIVIRILDYERFLPFKIYKKPTEESEQFFESLSRFDDITQYVTFDIRKDNKTNSSKVVLDIEI